MRFRFQAMSDASVNEDGINTSETDQHSSPPPSGQKDLSSQSVKFDTLDLDEAQHKAAKRANGMRSKGDH